MLWFFLIFSTSCWGLAEIFYKKGNVADEAFAVRPAMWVDLGNRQ